MACFHLWTGTGFQDQHLALVLQCFGQELVALVEIRKDQCGVKVELETLELIRVQVVCVGELLSPVHKDDVREFVLSQAGTGPEGKVIGQVDPVDDQLEGTPLSRHFQGIARHPDEGPVVFWGFPEGVRMWSLVKSWASARGQGSGNTGISRPAAVLTSNLILREDPEKNAATAIAAISREEGEFL